MERRGLLRRENHVDNERATEAVLAPGGLRTVKRAAPRHVESVRRHFIDLLTETQVDVLGDATEQIIRHLRNMLDSNRTSDDGFCSG